MEVETFVKTVTTAAEMVDDYKASGYCPEKIEEWVNQFAIKIAARYVELERAKLPLHERNSLTTKDTMFVVWESVYNMAFKGAQREMW